MSSIGNLSYYTGTRCKQYVDMVPLDRHICMSSMHDYINYIYNHIYYIFIYIFIYTIPGSEEMGVFGVGSIPVAILPSCIIMKLLHHNCIDMNIVG